MRTIPKIALAALVAVLATTSAASADPLAASQRVAVESRGGVFAFALVPLGAGSLKRDSGTTTWDEPARRAVVRNGQRVDIDDTVGRFEGNRGSFIARFHIEWTSAGNDFTAGSGRWTLVGGTGEYAGLRGGGRSGHVWRPGGKITLRAEGVLKR